jgi:hypothetical protein
MSTPPCDTPYPMPLPGGDSSSPPVRCRLPRGHHSAEHWHSSPNTTALVWLDDDDLVRVITHA